MTVEIPLTHGFVAIVDDDDRPIVGRFSWHTHPGRRRRTYYARTTLRLPDGRRVLRFMHTVITGWTATDHINGDGLDNRRSNLRPATNRQNLRNRRKAPGQSSRFKGVHWDAERQSWAAAIYLPGRKVRLGRYSHEEDAARAYDSAARMEFGEFAALNFPAFGERSALGGPPEDLQDFEEGQRHEVDHERPVRRRELP